MMIHSCPLEQSTTSTLLFLPTAVSAPKRAIYSLGVRARALNKMVSSSTSTADPATAMGLPPELLFSNEAYVQVPYLSLMWKLLLVFVILLNYKNFPLVFHVSTQCPSLTAIPDAYPYRFVSSTL